MPVPICVSTPACPTTSIVRMPWTSLVHLSQTKKRISRFSRPPHAQLCPTQSVVRRPVAAQKTGERHHLVDDCQIGVNVAVLFQQLSQLTPPAGQLALHAADRQMRMKAALLLGIAQFRFECLVDL